MAKKVIPVYSIENFKHFKTQNDFYTNSMKQHLAEHHFTATPHKHDFFLTVMFTKGYGTHDIDFTSYKIAPGSVFLLTPGQTHNWKLSNDIDGYIFFHTKNFYDESSVTSILNFPFFNSIHSPPIVLLSSKNKEKIKNLFIDINTEYLENNLLKNQKLHALVTLAYIELSRLYKEKEISSNQTYRSKLRQLENLIDLNFKTIKYATDYANLMAISEKHLNRISKTCLNKTTTDIITDRIILEAKRILTHTSASISEISEDLGYLDHSYFARLFKKKTGKTPLEFRKKNRY
ncbi:MAG: helix-turn-helix transcriptional regulator [Bacteroidota bacterium]|nr:helix-turn-helix transcriptional regulator [Bacteroidota bacterium]MDP3147187.1 helix-turn-helix transcriptional regulator [Bacteroidota bacterium]